MNGPIKSFGHQHGQVAIIVGITILLLIMMIGLVVDLGFLYTRKTEFQNAADAAALAGAKELNGTETGIHAAVTEARKLAEANNVNFGGTPISDAVIRFGPTPDGNWSDEAAAAADPRDKRFVRVDTGLSSLGSFTTWFMRVAAITTTRTYGMAVAGARTVKVLPIAACALDGTPDTATKCNTPDCGYRKGLAYKLSEVNPIGPGTIFWIDAVATQPGECNGNVPDNLPFICVGEVSAGVAFSDTIFTNTGVSVPQLEALDSRFNEYSPQGRCEPATAPPDQNIKQYLYNDPNVADWMNPVPTTYTGPIGTPCSEPKRECQASRVVSKVGVPPVITTDRGGVIWSFVRPPSPYPATSATDSLDPTANISSDGYLIGRTPVWGAYPGTGTPYHDPAKDARWYEEPTGHTPAPDRRVLNMLIVACPAAGGNCRPTKVLSSAQFLLQKQSSTPGDHDIYIEYGGPVFRGLTRNISLYR